MQPKELRIQPKESGTHGVESRIRDCLGFPYMGVQEEWREKKLRCGSGLRAQIAYNEIYVWQALASFVITAVLTYILLCKLEPWFKTIGIESLLIMITTNNPRMHRSTALSH